MTISVVTGRPFILFSLRRSVMILSFLYLHVLNISEAVESIHRIAAGTALVRFHERYLSLEHVVFVLDPHWHLHPHVNVIFEERHKHVKKSFFFCRVDAK